MGERAQKIIIRNGQMKKYYSQWGGQRCFDTLMNGVPGLESDLSTSEQYDSWVIPEFAEGGYLVDFDAKVIMLFSWDAVHLNEVLPRIQKSWNNWVVQRVSEGVPDFQAYVQDKGLSGA